MRVVLGPLLVLAFVAGCSEEPVAPIAGQRATPAASTPQGSGPAASQALGSAPPTPAPQATRPQRTVPPPATTRPQGTATSAATPATSSATQTTPACLGPVVYEIDGADSADRPRSLCLTVGGKLRIRNIGPDEVSTSQSDVAVCTWEAGIDDCQMVHAGTVAVTITKPSSHTIEVVAVD
ncbi:hypothetical protein [Mangrovihabitans endophyticus]|uniref:Uncharacterized protein n=1 Tax=Mangrovihabitans endophyticus TaxID=1751298 RepID=A0A8J3C6N7_9ACTN|nr:hypothetical protein [Mangrovihabitans endophyticus]GGL14461.1 hypothetical protein GCM10012284_56550 [Mangrovihabitans endophyticus]